MKFNFVDFKTFRIIFFLENSYSCYIYMMMLFFNGDWAGACRGRWAGPGLLVGWDVGFRIVGVEVGSLLRRRTGMRLLLL